MLRALLLLAVLCLSPSSDAFHASPSSSIVIRKVGSAACTQRIPVLRRRAPFTITATTSSRIPNGQDDGLASSDVVEGPFQGQFGVWFVNQHDAMEVITYRLSLVAAALSVAAGTALAISNQQPPAVGLDLCALGFLASFGVSVATIHIYMKPMHNFLKALWASGVAGSIAVLASQPSHHLVAPTFEHPELLLASGWVFVALTGLFFKEFACFQRWEASALFALVPVLTGGHFLHILPLEAEQAMAVALSSVFLFFAARKFTQPYKADIGDKTIFELMAAKEAADGGQ